MNFGTVVNCTDGRLQFPVLDYLKEQIRSSLEDHASKIIVLVGLYVNEAWEVEEYARLEPGEVDY